MAGNYGITADDVRLLCGIGTVDISDTNVETFIVDAEAEADRLLNSAGAPKRKMETLIPSLSGGHDTPQMILHNLPVLTINKIRIGGTVGTEVDPSNTVLLNESGLVFLTSSASATAFQSGIEEKAMIDYTAGMMDESTTETTLSAKVGTGSSKSMSVASGNSFSIGDYVKIEGTDNNYEIVCLTGTTATTLTSSIKWEHESGSRVVKMQTPQSSKRLTKVLAGLMCAINMIGSTYTFATSYSFPEHSVNKGVPYPHFEKVINRLTQMRDELLEKVYRPKICIM